MIVDFELQNADTEEIKRLEARISVLKHSVAMRQNVWEQVMSNGTDPNLDSKTKCLIAIQLALDDDIGDCPQVVPELRDRLLKRIADLKAQVVGSKQNA